MGVRRPGAGARRPRMQALFWGSLSGILAAASFPGVGLWPLAALSQAPVLWWLYRVRPGWRLGAIAGAADGLALYTIVFYWIGGTLEEMSGAPVALGWLAVLAHAAVMGLHQVLWAAAVAGFDRLSWVRSALWRRAGLSALSYVAIEFAVPFLFPLHLGDALYASPIWLQPADIFGIEGVTGLCVLSAALIAAAAAERSWAVRTRRLSWLLLLLVLWRGYGGLRVWQHDRLAVLRSLSVAVVQPNPSMGEKRALKASRRLPMLARDFKVTRGLDLRGVDVVLWPEGSLPFFFVPLPGEPEAEGLEAKEMRAPPVLLKMARSVLEFAQKLGKPMVIGTLRRPDPRWKKRARNAALLLWPDGHKVFYDKQRLVPFGEFLPGRSLFPSLATAVPGVSDMAEGEGGAVFSIAGVQVGMTICYEAVFPEHVWDRARGADVLFNLTDDIWFGATNAPELHLMVQALRAVEMRRPLVRAAATGVSAVVDELGRIVERTPIYKTTSFVREVPVRQMGSPYRWWGPWPLRLFSLLFFGALLGLPWLVRRQEDGQGR